MHGIALWIETSCTFAAIRGVLQGTPVMMQFMAIAIRAAFWTLF